MKYFVIILSILYVTFPACTQHCEWDNSALIAVRPLYNGEFIEHLKVELISTDNPWSTKEETHRNGLYSIYKENTKAFTKRNKIKRLEKSAYFDFVKNDYVVLTSNQFKESLFVKITDERNHTHGQRIGTQMIPITKEHLLGLCGIREGLKNYDSLYTPIVVALHSDQMMNEYKCDLNTQHFTSVTLYTAPVIHKDDSLIFQLIQTGISIKKNKRTFEHEFFKIYPYRFALDHFDSLKHVNVDEKGWVLDYAPLTKTEKPDIATATLTLRHDTLPQPIKPKKVAEAYDEIPSLKAFIAFKLANGNEGMEKYYLKANIEQFNSAYLYEYLDTYNSLDSEKLAFDLDEDRDLDYCMVYSKPERHIEFYVFDNELSQFVKDTMMSNAPYLYLNLKEKKLVIADYPMPQMSETNVKKTYIRWNTNWQLIEWELEDYLSPHNNVNEASSRRLNDTLCMYDVRTKRYIQHGDYNFDGSMDTRIAYDSNIVFHHAGYYCEKFDYFIYDKEKGEAIKDEFLSSGTFTFDFKNNTAVGFVEKRNFTEYKVWIRVSNKYEWIDKKFVKTEIVEQIQACHNCEQIITITSKLIDGKWQQVDFNPGAE